MGKKILWLWDNIEQIIASLLLLSMVVLLTIQVFSRFILHSSVPWTEEASRYVFLSLVYVGVSLVAKQNAHIRIVDHMKLLPKRFKGLLLLISDIIWIGFNVIVAIEGIKLFDGMGEHAFISPAMQWNMKYIFLVIPLSFLLASIRIIENNIKKFIKKEKVPLDPTGID